MGHLTYGKANSNHSGQ